MKLTTATTTARNENAQMQRGEEESLLWQYREEYNKHLSILLIYFRKDNNHKQFPSSLFSQSSSVLGSIRILKHNFPSDGC
jgi:hypothetical protein